MPGKKSDVADLTVQILREIRDEAKQTNARLDRGFAALRREMHQGFEDLGGRIDNLLLGEHRREHEEIRERVERIEQHLGLDSG